MPDPANTVARPQLNPALRRLWRDPSTLQLGLEPRHAVVLTGLTAPERAVLELLDGTREAAEITATAGVDAAVTEQLCTMLRAAGALTDAADDDALHERGRQLLAPDRLSLSLVHRDGARATGALAARRTSSVAVHGLGRVGATLAGLLAAGGVGTLTLHDPAPVRLADIAPGGLRNYRDEPRDAAMADSLARFTEVTASTAQPPGAPALAVVAPVGSVAAPEVLAAVHDVPHLVVAVRETTSSVGPLVVPGRTPCLRCVELSRGDRDPHWPTLTAQLAAGGRAVEACDIALATLAASLAAMQVFAFLDGAHSVAALGGVVEFDLVDGRLRRRSLVAHPDCGCGAGG